MESEAQIRAAIERRVGNVPYSLWNIGVTDDPTRRMREHANEGENTVHWIHWNADTETAARNVEKYFVAKGMRSAPDGGGNADYVYVF